MTIAKKTGVTIGLMITILVGVLSYTTWIDAKYATKEYVATIKEDIGEIKDDIKWITRVMGK